MANKKCAKIVFHTDCEPDTILWKKVKSISGNSLLIQFVTVQNTSIKPKYPDRFSPFIFWQTPKFSKIEHLSDVYRIYLLYKYGGIYLDDDK